MQANEAESDLINALKRGESPAFRKVYVLYFGMIRYLIVQNKGREEDAKDIFQEALVVLYEQLSTGKLILTCELKTWLYAVCRNKWLRQLEKSKRELKFTDFEPIENVSVPQEEKSDEVHVMLRKSLEQLGVQCRKMLLLFYYFRKSMEEIAVDMSYTNADNAKAQKYKCLQKLKMIYKNPSAS